MINCNFIPRVKPERLDSGCIKINKLFQDTSFLKNFKTATIFKKGKTSMHIIDHNFEPKNLWATSW